MANIIPRGKIPQQVANIFEKYMSTEDSQARRLHKQDALCMLNEEFGLEQDQAEKLFNTFDKDKNEVMSIWEFQQFYQIIGNTAADMVAKFEELDVDRSGKLDPEEARAGLRCMTSADGKSLEEKEIEFFIKSSLGDDNLIDLGSFASLLYRLKVYKKPAPAKRGRR